MKHLLVLCAPGFEETEMIAVVDVMRRLGVHVITAGLAYKTVTGSHDLEITADATLGELFPGDFDAVFLPGGMPGATNLRDDEEVIDALTFMQKEGKILSAICAAPMVLGKIGALKGKRFTMYPGMESFLPAGLHPSDKLAERDGRIVTGKGPGAVFAFAGELAAALGLEKECRSLYQAMFVEQKPNDDSL